MIAVYYSITLGLAGLTVTAWQPTNQVLLPKSILERKKGPTAIYKKHESLGYISALLTVDLFQVDEQTRLKPGLVDLHVLPFAVHVPRPAALAGFPAVQLDIKVPEQV